jgi:HlyD family secretion protein
VTANAIDKRLADEHQRDLDTAMAAERTAQLAVLTARAQLAAAAAKVEQARSEQRESQAAAQVAEARLGIARVNLDYSRIVAPFDGVVTLRTFHPGAFIRSAADGGGTPLFTAKRTDLMRVVVQVPDRDVIQTNQGDPAIVKVDALEGREFQGKVARIADSEDPTTRTMRVEIDLPNPERLLREGMYGTCTIRLDPETRNLTIPRACVVEPAGRSKGIVFVVRDGAARRLVVDLGADNGSLIEVLTGLRPSDEVIARAGVRLEDGLPVIAAAGATVPTDR